MARNTLSAGADSVICRCLNGDDWVHEIKWDGYRVQAHLRDGKATVYRPIVDAAARLPAKRAIIDGEAVVLAENGLADFHALRSALDGRSQRLRLYAFGRDPHHVMRRPTVRAWLESWLEMSPS